MNEEQQLFYDELLHLAQSRHAPLRQRYRALREALEHALHTLTADSGLQATDLSARINYAAEAGGLTRGERNGLHTFRLTSNDVLNHRREPEESAFVRDVGAVAAAYARLTATVAPPALHAAQAAPAAPPHPRRGGTRIRQLRVSLVGSEGDILWVLPDDTADDTPLRVACNREGVNAEFAETLKCLWKHARLNLLDVTVEADGTLVPEIIVLEPDYLIDISTLAECFRSYGAHPGNYMLGKFNAPGNTRAILTGNIANLFLDAWIHAEGDGPTFTECMKKAFRRYALELTTCAELTEPEQERAFATDCRLHFEHIRQTVCETFGAAGYGLRRDDAVLEPSYICEALGIQGRLDYMQRDMSRFIEMKSGKADEYALRGRIVPMENHLTQMLLYMAVLEYGMGADRRTMRPYLFYTRYPLLYPARPSWAQVRRAIDLRNRIVAEEHAIQRHNDPGYTLDRLRSITPETLNTKKRSGRFWEHYLLPPIAALGERINRLNDVERAYFATLYGFIVREAYTAKSGEGAGEGQRSAAALWRATAEEKRAMGEILFDLRLADNRAACMERPTVELTLPPADDDACPANFRPGDAVVLYERNGDGDNMTNRMVFKATIEEITDAAMRLRLREAQRNSRVFPPDSCYAVEHDAMDVGFRAMYRGLAAYLDADPSRRRLLLGLREPRFDTHYDDAIARADDDFERIALKACAAKDYFLLVGPPGTGKTSRALRRMVELFHADAHNQLLLLAYTNRAVDEICQSVSTLSVPFLRIGNEVACDPRFHPHLLENALATCATRRQIREKLEQCRVFVGTVAAVAARPELFALKHFEAAIVDEATQILEPQLLGILCARCGGHNAVERFILIGDHKQLPAVVLQSRGATEVKDAGLRQTAGLTNLADSLFERLYRRHRNEKPARACDILLLQGRMHPGVADFANRAFYGGRLVARGLPHQLEEINCPMLFIPSRSLSEYVRDLSKKHGQCATDYSDKTNPDEARIAARAALSVLEEKGERFDASRSLGIITPYRSQIALIRKALRETGNEALCRVTVDTVERYQGSERDVIIYSFCMNRPYQLELLPNLTEEDGVLIDRKLNVALTRARQRIILTGVPALLRRNPLYGRLIDAARWADSAPDSRR